MHLHISPNDGAPIYLQIANQVAYLVASGRLEPLRAASRRSPRGWRSWLLHQSGSTRWSRAYRELEDVRRTGCRSKRRTAGTFVSDNGSPLAKRERTKILTARIDALLAEAAQLSFTLEEILEWSAIGDRFVQHAGMQS